MPTRDQCIREAAAVVSEGFAVLYEWPLDAAAERCRRQGEPLEAARDRVEARRALRREQARAAA